MAAATASVPTKSRNLGAKREYLMTSDKTIYAGTLVMLVAGGTAEPASAVASNVGCPGVATRTVTNAASGTSRVEVQEGDFLFAADTLEQEDVGGAVYADDDQTIDETQASNTPKAGILVEYVSASLGWVAVSQANAI